MRILIAGLTTRAMAESARRAGRDVLTVDYFGDLDQKQLCENLSLRERGIAYSSKAIVRVVRALAYDAVVYCGGFENHPVLVAELARGGALLGNGPEALRRVRNPRALFPALAAQGFAVPRSVACGEPPPDDGAWLLKPLRSGGGQGIRVWDGRPLSPGHFLQEYVDGVPASAVFVADGERSLVVGWSEQVRGPRGFLYGGNILPLDAPQVAFAEVRAIAECLTRKFALRGLNGFDFVLSGARPIVVEVNPRYCASMELVERAAGVSVFELHLAGCRGAVPGAPAAPGSGYWGKAIVYAREVTRVGDTRRWIERGVRDVPHPDDTIGPGEPICTVFAWGPSRAACVERLRVAEETILREVSRELASP